MSRTEHRIERLVNAVDVARIQKAMRALNWTWATCGDHVPSETDIRKTIYDCIRAVLDKDILSCGCGGINVTRDKYDCLRVSFEVTWCDEDVIDPI
jgi:hypothetical protein